MTYYHDYRSRSYNGFIILIAVTSVAVLLITSVEGFSIASSSSSALSKTSSSASSIGSQISFLPKYQRSFVGRYHYSHHTPSSTFSRSRTSLTTLSSTSSTTDTEESKPNKKPLFDFSRLVLPCLLQKSLLPFHCFWWLLDVAATTVTLKLRRSLLLVYIAIVLCFGGMGVSGEGKIGFSTNTAHATTTTTTTTLNNPTTSRTRSNNYNNNNNHNQKTTTMIDQYVKEHMFNDDVYDPIESIYREAMDDRLHGTYPKAIKEVTMSVLGKDVVQKAERARTKNNSVGAYLVKAVQFLRHKMGWSESFSIALLASTIVIGTPSIVFAILIMVSAQNKRSINRLMKKRYGETYTVDATIKVEEDVEAPEDDDDDDDDEDAHDDDDDKKNKN